MTHSSNSNTTSVAIKKDYVKPEINNPGSLAELTQGFAGSIPDEQGGQTKRNPFAG